MAASSVRPARASRGGWDCVVVGSGPAGLSAAIYMGRFGRRTLVVDAGDGRWSYGQVNDNYLGFPAGVGARRLHRLGRAQAKRFGVSFLSATVTAIERDGSAFRLRAGGRVLRGRTVIWAAGVRDHWPEFPGARQLVGKRMFWCLTCDGWRTWRKPVLLLGNDQEAARTTLQFLTYTRRLALVVEPGRRLSAAARTRLAEEGVTVLEGRIKSVLSPDGQRLQVRLEDGRRLRPAYIFSLLGNSPRTEALRSLHVAVNRKGIRTDDKNRTSLPAFFAAGDVTDRHSHQVVTAAHEGATAAQAANQVLYPPAQKLPGKGKS